MDDTAIMQICQSIGDLRGDARCERRRDGSSSASQRLVEVHRQPFEHHERLPLAQAPPRQDREDVWMLDAPQGTRLIDEPRLELLIATPLVLQDLDRYGTPTVYMDRFVDFAHRSERGTTDHLIVLNTNAS